MRVALIVLLVAAPFLLADAHVMSKIGKAVDTIVVQPIKVITRPITSIFNNNKNKATPDPIPIAIEEITNDIDELDEEVEHTAEHEEEEGEEHEAAGHHFGYDEGHGPETWPEEFPTCGGKHQSPINIVESETEIAKPGQYPDLVFTNYWEKPDKMELTNNGHALQISGTWSDGKWPSISGGPLEAVYRFKQSHIHWGQTDNTGSEHLVDGKSMPLEMHTVHWNTNYGSFEEALNHEDGLAVMGQFGMIGKDESPMWGKFIHYAESVEGNTNAVQEIEPMPINILNMDSAKNEYVTYKGSLTTPPCTENVMWIVATEPTLLSANQMEILRSIVKNAHGEEMHNNRPPQELNDRTVTLVKSQNIA